MGNETYHYFGAYLEVKTRQIEQKEYFKGCENGHRSGGPFCDQCGLPVGDQERVVLRYPYHIWDILGDEYEDALTTKTPRGLFDTGTMILAGNLNKPSGDWLHLSRWGGDIEIKQFPTSDEINKMISDLETNYANVIKALKNHEAVISITTKAGYVLDEEY